MKSFKIRKFEIAYFAFVESYLAGHLQRDEYFQKNLVWRGCQWPSFQLECSGVACVHHCGWVTSRPPVIKQRAVNEGESQACSLLKKLLLNFSIFSPPQQLVLTCVVPCRTFSPARQAKSDFKWCLPPQFLWKQWIFSVLGFQGLLHLRCFPMDVPSAAGVIGLLGLTRQAGLIYFSFSK